MNTSESRRVALITGASRGIGRACAQALAREGHAVAIHYHAHQEDAEATASTLAKEGAATHTVAADLAKPGEAARVVAEVREALGPPTILVHAAGALLEKPLMFTKPDEWSRLLELHAVSAWHMNIRQYDVE